MEKEILAQAMENGIWVTLFVSLYLYTLYDSRQREYKYQIMIHENQNIIKELSKKLNIVHDIQKNVCDIKDEMKRR